MRWNENFLKNLKTPHIGVDEVGRGCLAGPVCAAAVILSSSSTSSYQDSKSLTPQIRKTLSIEIQKKHHCGIGFATVEEIDGINILQASLLAMKRAVLKLSVPEGGLLVDGKHIIPNLNKFIQIAVIKGDSLIPSIAAASIVAKHFRDEWMDRLDQKYVGYGWSRNKGYGTALHRRLIQEKGPSPLHRRSFKGVKEYLCRL